jgi:hypothetical protein
MRPTSLLLAAIAALLVLAAAPAGAGAAGVWGGCGGGEDLTKPVKVQHCTRDVSYSLYVDRVEWAAFGGDQATGIGTAYVNPCDVSCQYGVWYPNGSASVTLSRPKACGDRRIYTHGLIQLQAGYEGRTVFEENYPCKQVVRSCAGSVRNGALRGIAQRATTCAKAKGVVRGWARAAGYQVRRTTRASVRVGAYRCRRQALKHHQLQVTCNASARRLVRFRAIRG